MSKPYGFVYLTTNLINNKKYIGQKKYIKGWEYYLGSGKHLKSAIKKYGKENFQRTILVECFSKEELDKSEIEMIKKYNAVENDEFYNIASGGEGGYNLAEFSNEQLNELKKKIKKSLRKTWNEKGKEIIEKRNKTRENWTEVRKKLNSQKLSIALSGKNNPMYGKQHNDTTRQLIREKALGRKGFWEGKHLPQDVKEKISEKKNKLVTNRNKKIICLNTKEVFTFVYEAQEKYNIKGHSIIQECCNGIKKSAGELNGEKLRWMYYEDYIKSKEITEYENNSFSKVVCINTGEIFESMKEAAERFNLKTHSSISKCCRGKCKTGGKHPITGERLRWAYVR